MNQVVTPIAPKELQLIPAAVFLNYNMKKGFTLIEILLYVTIASMVLLSIEAFLMLSLQSRIKNQVIAEVEQNGAQITQIITQNIRNSSNYSVISTTQLFLTTDNLPIDFSLSNNSLMMSEGTNNYMLTPSLLKMTNLSFTDLSHLDTPGIIKIQFDLEYINNKNRNEYNYSKTFYATASLR